METPDKAGSIEKYLEDTIKEYLKSQQDVPEFNFEEINDLELESQERAKTQFIVEDVLNDVLNDVERTIIFQKQYDKIQRGHPQFALFDLSQFVPEFQLDENMIKMLCFRESLLISNIDERGGPDGVKPMAVGGLCLKIELAQGLGTKAHVTEKELEKNIMETIKQLKKDMAQKSPDEPDESTEEKLKKYEAYLQEEMSKAPAKFVVHLSSTFDLDGSNGGSRIVSWVDKLLHTLEERRTEYIYENNQNKETQTLYFAIQEHKYYVRHQWKAADTDEKRRYCALSELKDLVGEGANLILMRYLAVSRYKGTFELATFYINGDLCRNIYECKGPRPGYINGQPVEVCKIYRTIIEQCGLYHISVTVMTVFGIIISQEWEGCPYIIHINPEFVTSGKPVPYDVIALKKVWDTNMEFVSKYLDCKTVAELKMKTYRRDHPEIQALLDDYLQSVLLLKPENIMPFTIDYFMSYQPYQLPQLPYFDEINKDKEESEQFW